MIVIGIDPGTARLGYGVIKKERGKISFLDAGILKINKTGNRHTLLQIKTGLDSIFKKWKPEIVGVERVYFSKNQKTAMSVAEARGVIILAVLEAGAEIKECSPNEVKSGLTGYGHADKRGVAKMVNLALGTPDLKIIDDASDALAIAIFAAGTPRDGKRPS